jgi:hypothetical protein
MSGFNSTSKSLRKRIAVAETDANVIPAKTLLRVDYMAGALSWTNTSPLSRFAVRHTCDFNFARLVVPIDDQDFDISTI